MPTSKELGREVTDADWEQELGEELALLRSINKLQGEERVKWHRVMFGFEPSRIPKFPKQEEKEPAIREYFSSDLFPNRESYDE